jgi:hypothetical protein
MFCTTLNWSGYHDKEKVLVQFGKQTPLFQPALGYFTELLHLLKRLTILGLDVKVKVIFFYSVLAIREHCTKFPIS